MDLFVKCHLKLHIDITLYDPNNSDICNAC